MAYTPYEWTVNSYLNPTRMNAIEQGIAAASQAAESASGEFHTIEELIGTQSIAGIGDGTLTGATWKINNDLSDLKNTVTTLNSNLQKIFSNTVTFQNNHLLPAYMGNNKGRIYTTVNRINNFAGKKATVNITSMYVVYNGNWKSVPVNGLTFSVADINDWSFNININGDFSTYANDQNIALSLTGSIVFN